MMVWWNGESMNDGELITTSEDCSERTWDGHQLIQGDKEFITFRRFKLFYTSKMLSRISSSVYEQKFNFHWTPNTDLATRFCQLRLRAEFENTVWLLRNMKLILVILFWSRVHEFLSNGIYIYIYLIRQNRLSPSLKQEQTNNQSKIKFKNSCTPLPCSLVKYCKGLSKMLIWHI